MGDDSEFLINRNQPALANKGNYNPWEQAGKASMFNVVPGKSLSAHAVRTGVHIGEGLFLTNGHVTQWPLLAESQTVLRHATASASGYLHPNNEVDKLLSVQKTAMPVERSFL